MEYKIDKGGMCSYNPYNDTITIGLKSNTSLTDSEIIKSLSDSIIHEHIHRLLFLQVNITTSVLFDIIEHKFRDISLQRKRLQSDYFNESWLDVIERNGFKFIIKHYIDMGMITEFDIKEELKNWN